MRFILITESVGRLVKVHSLMIVRSPRTNTKIRDRAKERREGALLTEKAALRTIQLHWFLHQSNIWLNRAEHERHTYPRVHWGGICLKTMTNYRKSSHNESLIFPDILSSLTLSESHISHLLVFSELKFLQSNRKLVFVVDKWIEVSLSQVSQFCRVEIQLCIDRMDPKINLRGQLNRRR